jgi:hypothetical protein
MRAGDRFGSLEVVRRMGVRCNALWLLKCDCGKHRVLSYYKLKAEVPGPCDGDCGLFTDAMESVDGDLDDLILSHGMNVKSVRRRLELGWSLERALDVDVMIKRRRDGHKKEDGTAHDAA